MDSSDAVRFYAEKRSEHFKKYLNGKIQVTWSFLVEHHKHIAHCHVVGQNMEFFGDSESGDMNQSIDLVVDKIEKQLKKHKEVLTQHHH
jgi:putative sigma-54 modulation protein